MNDTNSSEAWIAVEQCLGTKVPRRMKTLGYMPRVINNIPVILPPVVTVPAGPFWMGSDKAVDTGAYDDEYRHQLSLAEYQIATYPLTVAEWACAVAAGQVKKSPTSQPYTWKQQFHRLDHPVVGISWLATMKYLRWLSQVTGELWRLPTEAEWEKAARGTDGRIYPWGNEWDASRANTSDGGPDKKTPVGKYAKLGDASPYGCHDMAGNVWEWTSSIYVNDAYQPDTSHENNTNTSSARVLRGGSWVGDPRSARAAYRSGVDPADVSGLVGARLAHS